MNTAIDTTVELPQEQIDFRALLDIEILAIGGGDNIVNTY